MSFLPTDRLSGRTDAPDSGDCNRGRHPPVALRGARKSSNPNPDCALPSTPEVVPSSTPLGAQKIAVPGPSQTAKTGSVSCRHWGTASSPTAHAAPDLPATKTGLRKSPRSRCHRDQKRYIRLCRRNRVGRSMCDRHTFHHLLHNPIWFKNTKNTTIPPNGVRSRSVSCSDTFCPSNILVPCASIRPVYDPALQLRNSGLLQQKAFIRGGFRRIRPASIRGRVLECDAIPDRCPAVSP